LCHCPVAEPGAGNFFFSFERHRVLRVNVFRTMASPSVSPPQDNIRAFVTWQTSIPSGPTFRMMGFQVAHYPWFKGSKLADGRDYLTHVGTHWSMDVPFVALFLLFAVAPAIRIGIAWRGRVADLRGRCQKCRYDLTGNPSGVCPECGSPWGSIVKS